MARAAKTTTKDIESLKHREARRKHIPTTELENLVSEEERAPKVIRYKRNTDLDPQLVWRGKDEQDAEDLMVDSVPIYIQEKIQPEKIISDLKRRSEAIRRERVENEQYAMPDLYSDFNGLAEPGAEFTFYKHDKNWSNRMVLGDSLLVMTSLAEKEALKGQVQCIYMDPPYGIKFNSNWQPSTKSRKVKEGQEGLTRDPEMIRAFRDTWKDGVHSYLSYLRDRVAAAHMLLASEGSIFLQIGEENLHLVRSVLQEIFLPENFVVTFAIQKTGSVSGDFVQSNLNYILWFAKNTEAAKDKFHALFKYRSSSGFERSSENSLDRTDFEAYPLTSEGNRETTTVPFKFQGKSYHPGEDRHWGVLPSGLERVAKAGRILPQKNQIRLKYFEDDFPVLRLGSSWNDVGGATDKIYVVQTTPKVIERCILLTTDPGDLVLDPTCGSGTTAIVAEQWGRRWITIDTSRVALALAPSCAALSQIVGGESIEDEIAALARWLRDLHGREIEPGQIAIFGRTRQVVRERADAALAQAGLTGRWLSPDSDLATDAVAIGTMHAAKGFEFRAVALIGCDAEHLPFTEALAGAESDDARRLVEEREIHLLYVGCTRARESLLITYSGEATPYLSLCR